jgi:hypothetical protein
MAEKKADGNPVWVSETVKTVLADFRELRDRGGVTGEEALKILDFAYRKEGHDRLCNYFPEVFWHEFCGAMRALFGDSPSFKVEREP